MTKRKTLIAAAFVLTTLGVTAISVSAEAATTPIVQFTGVYYNSPGSDTRTNASLNAEWFKVNNTTGKPLSVKGWTVRDNQNHIYTFGTLTLAAHSSAVVHTGKGTNAKPHTWDRYWGSGNYIWNNTGDKATLKNNAGKVIDTCSWPNKGSYTAC